MPPLQSVPPSPARPSADLRRVPGAQPRALPVLVLLAVASCGVLLFLVGLGATGVVDETPAVFAASARAMAQSGDWLIPRINGLPRYDKPPLVYWLMGALYALPGQAWWNPLGSWAARLPSALASIALMLVLAQTLLRWPQSGPRAAVRAVDALAAAGAARRWRAAHAVTAFNAALAFALGPLAWLWGRTEVSDALFSALLGGALLLAWRSYATDGGPWWPCWLLTALAVLTKGPVALVLLLLTLGLFGGLQADRRRLWTRLQPLRGIALTLAVAAPWYGLALLHEGEPYWRSFFGYHNLQRFTQVVNNHQQPWWYFTVVLLVAALPATPLLVHGLRRQLLQWRRPLAPERSLARFATCWLLAVLLFFSCAATKLPSYWLPATPAAALLVALALPERPLRRRDPFRRIHGGEPAGPAETPAEVHRAVGLALAGMAVLLFLTAAGLASARLWLHWIEEPSMPGLQEVLLQASWPWAGALVAAISGMLVAGLLTGVPALRLLQGQLVWLLMVPLVALPLWRMGDQLRGAPLRHLAALAQRERSGDQPLAMVGLIKPSFHYYSGGTVLFEGRSPGALLNLAERLHHERRPGLQPRSVERQPHVLLVIDAQTAAEPHWHGIRGQELGRAGPFRLLRLERRWLERRARELEREGRRPSWREPRMERL